MAQRFKKKYGQNFLKDRDGVLYRIAEIAGVTAEDHILEIGPGAGALTEILLEKAKSVTAVEIDTDLERGLRERFRNNPRFTLVMGDFLKTDLREILEEKGLSGRKIKVVANIPYYITSPILQKLIDFRALIDCVFVMVQKEVGERICAKRGKARGILTLAVEYYGEAAGHFIIGKECFTPVPKVDSALISICFYEKTSLPALIPEAVFFHYIHAAFAGKRKTLVNNLAGLGFEKKTLAEILRETGIAENERAENVSLAEYTALISRLEALKKT
ncbi:MAG: 16S rRNA (adenine(1518)-N(6)/adenine(1519)-N(6))-dimethyltransferase RsmA [Fusobacteriaceae bacterium]|nr:16S rRNA (adenine(1518)-N(6)/adenine(1519)-N(6))-dimethyltransferase RsmA [Fusobacteriaceae bacterium]